MIFVWTRTVLVLASLAPCGLGQTRPEQDEAKSYWNKVYAADRTIFVRQPTAVLVSAVKERRPGKALDIGMGQGRNAVFLAQKGWDVTGFDPSGEVSGKPRRKPGNWVSGCMLSSHEKRTSTLAHRSGN